MPAEIGQEAPDFTVPDQDGNPFTLSSLRGEAAVALVFYPFTFSGICEAELCQLRDDHSQFEDAGVQVVAISCNAKHVQKKWRDEMGFGFPVLTDFWPHGAVAQAYGVFNEKVGCAMRATFLIDRDGTIVDTFATAEIGTAREAARYAEGLAKLA